MNASEVIDAIEAGETPSAEDMSAAGICPDCFGFGYYNFEDSDERVKCRPCEGTGVHNFQ